MVRCSHHGCRRRTIAPSKDAAWTQYAEHLVVEHAKTADVPDGMAQVKFRGDERIAATFEEARKLHEPAYDERN